MASTAVVIADMGAAIAAGEVPGAFTAGRMAFVFPTLVYTGARGAQHSWTVRVELFSRTGVQRAIDEALLARGAELPAGAYAEITVDAQQVDGKRRDNVPTVVREGKNLGRANATNALTQALRDALGDYNAHKRKVNTYAASPSAAPPSAAPPSAAPPSVAPSSAAPSGLPAAVAPSAAPTTKLPVVSVNLAAASGSSSGTASSSAAASSSGKNKGKAEGAAFDPRPPPQLVKKLGETKDATLSEADFRRGVFVQRKFNGTRCIARVAKNADPQRDAVDAQGQEVEVALYSRTSRDVPGQPRLLAALADLARAAPAAAWPPGLAAHFDGEMYRHGAALHEISGQTRRAGKAADIELTFHVYDVFFPGEIYEGVDRPADARQAFLDAVGLAACSAGAPADAQGQGAPALCRVENYPAADIAEVRTLQRRFVAEGFEGAIARKAGAGYRYSYNNYHSANLVKIKDIHDSEFPVVGFTEGDRGKEVGAIIWICRVPKPKIPGDDQFHVVPKNMDYDTRRLLFSCLSELVPRSAAAPAGPANPLVTRFERDLRGLPLTVEYPELSAKTGKPSQAKALAFRTYEGGPAADPVRRLLAECAACDRSAQASTSAAAGAALDELLGDMPAGGAPATDDARAAEQLLDELLAD
jgi:ATP-dependent DNA ligase